MAYVEAYNPQLATITFDSVPTAKIGEVQAKCLEVLGKLASGETPMDMARMAQTLRQKKTKFFAELENSPEEVLVDAVIYNYLYDETGKLMNESMKLEARFDALLAETNPGFWRKILSDLLAGACICVEGVPSKAKGEADADAEKARIAAQRERLGEEGLKAAAAAVAAANEENDRPFPPAILDDFPIPELDGVSTHEIQTVRSAAMGGGGGGGGELASFAELPLKAQFDDVNSDFVKATVVLRTEGLVEAQRLLLPLWLRLLGELPVRRGEALVPHADVVAGLTETTLGLKAGLGSGGAFFDAGPFSQAVFVSVSAEAAKYSDATELMAEVLLAAEIDAERVRVQVQKLLNSVPRYKRSGPAVSGALHTEGVYAGDVGASNAVAASFIRQHRFLTALLARLDKDPSTVCAELAALTDALFTPGRPILHVLGASAKLGEVAAPWQKSLLPRLETRAKSEHQLILPDDAPERITLTGALRCPAQLTGGKVCALSSVDSGFLTMTSPFEVSFTELDTIAHMTVFNEVCCCLEGPFWKQVRGLGLAYSYGMRLDVEEKCLRFNLFKSGHLSKAFATAESIVRGFTSGATPLEQTAVETAISTCVYTVLAREQTVTDAATQSLFSHFRGYDEAAYNLALVQKIRKVTVESLQPFLSRVDALFDPATSFVTVACHPNKVEELLADFKERGRALEQVSDLDAAFPDCQKTALAGSDRAGCECPKCVFTGFKLPSA